MSATQTSASSFLTVTEVAVLLRVHEATIYRLCKAGRLPAIRLGGQIRIDREQLQIWLRRAPTRRETARVGGLGRPRT